jgi:hypothetical protein
MQSSWTSTRTRSPWITPKRSQRPRLLRRASPGLRSWPLKCLSRREEILGGLDYTLEQLTRWDRLPLVVSKVAEDYSADGSVDNLSDLLADRGISPGPDLAQRRSDVLGPLTSPLGRREPNRAAGETHNFPVAVGRDRQLSAPLLPPMTGRFRAGNCAIIVGHEAEPRHDLRSNVESEADVPENQCKLCVARRNCIR